MAEQLTLLDALAQSLLRAGSYNKNDQCPPAAILWPDKERQWEPLLPALLVLDIHDVVQAEGFGSMRFTAPERSPAASRRRVLEAGAARRHPVDGVKLLPRNGCYHVRMPPPRKRFVLTGVFWPVTVGNRRHGDGRSDT